MSDEAQAPAKAPLDAVRRLEQELARRLEIRRAAERRVRSARDEAAELMAVARERGIKLAADRRRDVLVAAARDAEHINAESEQETLRLRTAMQRVLDEGAASVLVELVLPPIPAEDGA